MRRRRRPAPPADRPTVRDTHLAYVASLSDADLHGDPDIPVVIGPRVYSEWLQSEIDRGKRNTLRARGAG